VLCGAVRPQADVDSGRPSGDATGMDDNEGTALAAGRFAPLHPTAE
jgi:hypothetical protein